MTDVPGDPAAGNPPTRPAPPFRRYWIYLTGLILLLGLSFQGARGLLDPDEGRYVQCAQEMLETGEFLTPHLGGQPHFTKPPFTYWTIAGSMALLGHSEGAARLPTGIAYAALSLMVGLLGTVMWDPRTGLLAAVVHATMLIPFAAGNLVTPDIWLAFWEAAALTAFWKGLRARSPWSRGGWLFLTGAAFGLAFLTKGPPGLLFIPALAAAALVPGSSGKARPRLLFHPAGYAAFALFGLAWFLIEGLREPGLLSYLVREEVVGRMAGQHHRNPEWYGALVVYGPTLTLGALPWCLAWPGILDRIRARFRSDPGWIRRSPRGMFLGLALVFPLVVFTLSRSRLPLYVLPLFIPMALATARALAPGELLRNRRRLLLGGAWVGFLLALRLGFAFIPGDWDARALYRKLPLEGVNEIVVADGRPHYGLDFYWEGPFRVISAASAYPGTPAPPSLTELLRGQEGTVLYLVRPSKAETVGKIARDSGLVVRAERRVARNTAVVCSPAGSPGTPNPR